jgi:hypothetical protein
MCVSQVGDAIARWCGYAPRARSDTMIKTPLELSLAQYFLFKGVFYPILARTWMIQQRN